MKILVADKIAAAGVEYLQVQKGFEVIEAYGSSPEELKALVADVHAIIVRSATQITADIIHAARNLKAVGRAGVGIDNIDVDAATEMGVIVLNTPGGNTIATAELTFTHLLCSARPIPQANASMKKGEWEKKRFAGIELYGKTLGVLGLGRIGSEVAKRAKAFNMKVLAYDPYLTTERANAMEVIKADLETLLEESDFITCHMPKTDETTHIISAKSIARMKKGVRIVNCARGGLIDEKALADAIKSGQVGAAGIDVFEKEPPAADHAFLKLDGVVVTPHLGASTVEAQEGVGIEVAEEITRALRGERISNGVNIPSVDPATLKILKPYLDLGFKLGTIIQQITPQEVSSLKITYWGKPIKLDTLPVTRAVQRGYLSKIAENVNDVNAPLALKRKGIQVESVRSNSDRDYNELIRVEATDANGNLYVLEGTLVGIAKKARLVHANGRDVEAELEGILLMMENDDVAGVVGAIGTILAKHSVNIANMSLSRNAIGGVALSFCKLDSIPSDEALQELKESPRIKHMHLIEL